MGRSRSRSPRRRRSHSRDRGREKDRERRRHRSRSRSRNHEKSRRRSRIDDKRSRHASSRSRSPRPKDNHRKPHKVSVMEKSIFSDKVLEGKDPDEEEMMELMGFCDFQSTKGKHIENNDVGEVHVILKRKYRQYMNRKGGFNRPLDFVA